MCYNYLGLGHTFYSFLALLHQHLAAKGNEQDYSQVTQPGRPRKKRLDLISCLWVTEMLAESPGHIPGEHASRYSGF